MTLKNKVCTTQSYQCFVIIIIVVRAHVSLLLVFFHQCHHKKSRIEEFL